MQKDSKILLVIGLIIAVGIIGLVTYAVKSGGGSSQLDDFATCISDSGAKFYGAFWCPHCQDQKKLFGNSVKKLPYVECSTPDGNGQNQLCTDDQIEGYPTWIFADGSRVVGGMSLEQLSEKTNCPIYPGGTVATTTSTATSTFSATSSSPVKTNK